MKRWIALIATAALLAAVLLASRGQRFESPAEPESSTPDQCIERMFRAAERGDVESYLDCFSGPQRERIERDLANQSRDAFAHTLVQALEPLRGFAIVGSQTSNSNSSHAKLDSADITVERIYANHNERQTYNLEQSSGAWRIRAIRAAQPTQPPIPYGTPVFDLPSAQSDPQ